MSLFSFMLDSADSAFFSLFKHHVSEIFRRIILEINVKKLNRLVTPSVNLTQAG